MEILDAAVTFEVDGRPVPWARAGRKHGQGSFTPKKVRDYQDRMRSAGIDALGGRPPLDGPLLLDVTFFLEIPITFPLWKRQAIARDFYFPTKIPDLDNLIKNFDAFNGNVWKDDKQVIRMDPQKLYNDRPRVEFAIYPIVSINSYEDWQDYIAAQTVLELG